MAKSVNIDILEGQILTEVWETDDDIVFTTQEDKRYKLYHNQDCCENVRINHISGDLNNLIDTPILSVIETIEDDNSDNYDVAQRTTYTFETAKGIVVINWLGTSNGYYSINVDFAQI